MNLSQELKDLTRLYVQTQTQIDGLNKQINQLRDYKQQVETGLIQQIRQAGLSQYGITYQGKKVYIGNDHTYDTLTFKFLEECFQAFFRANPGQAKQLLDFIKAQRLAKKETKPIIKLGVPSRSAGGANTVNSVKR